MSEKRDGWSKVEVISGVVSALMTTALAVVVPLGLESLKSAERAASVIEHLSSDSPNRRRMALSVIDEYWRNKQVSDAIAQSFLVVMTDDPIEDVRNAAVEIAKYNPGISAALRARMVQNLAAKTQSSGSEGARNAAQALAQLAEPSTQETQTSGGASLIVEAEKAIRALPTRVYFHIGKDEQRAYAKDLAAKLTNSVERLVVPGVQLIRNTLSMNELRYFRPEDRDDANRIAAKLVEFGLKVKAVDQSIYARRQNSKLRPRHFELWLGPDTVAAI